MLLFGHSMLAPATRTATAAMAAPGDAAGTPSAAEARLERRVRRIDAFARQLDGMLEELLDRGRFDESGLFFARGLVGAIMAEVAPWSSEANTASTSPSPSRSRSRSPPPPRAGENLKGDGKGKAG